MLRRRDKHCAASARRKNCYRSFRNGHPDLITKSDKSRIGIIRFIKRVARKIGKQSRMAMLIGAFQPLEHFLRFPTKGIRSCGGNRSPLAQIGDQRLKRLVGLFSFPSRKLNESEEVIATRAGRFELDFAGGRVGVAS